MSKVSMIGAESLAASAAESGKRGASASQPSALLNPPLLPDASRSPPGLAAAADDCEGDVAASTPLEYLS